MRKGSNRKECFDPVIIEDEKEIERVLSGETEIEPSKADKIIKKIRRALDDHSQRYKLIPNEPSHLEIESCVENKPFVVQIYYLDDEIHIFIEFPFRVQANAIALMGIYMARPGNPMFGKNPLALNSNDGEVYMRYSYLCNGVRGFNGEHFWMCLNTYIQNARAIYVALSHISAGLVPVEDKRFYRNLLEMALETINGVFADDNVTYGTEQLELEMIAEQEDEDEDACDSDVRVANTGNTDEFIGREFADKSQTTFQQSNKRVLDRDKWMERMKGLIEGVNLNDNSSDPSSRNSDLFAFFEKPATINDKEVEAGGNKDE